jgi:hypothetical protein
VPGSSSEIVEEAKLLSLLLSARSTAGVDAILKHLPVVQEDEYHWISNKERHGTWQPGSLHWVPVGRNRGNGGNIKLAGEPFNPLAERAVHGLEALIDEAN